MSLKYYSQSDQDKFINEVIFKNKKNGYFIDIGAHDGVTISNTLFFEMNKNWNGICVEPNPLVFEKLNTNRKSINLNVCIGDEIGKVKFTQIKGYSEMLSGISSHYDQRHIERINKEILVKGGEKVEIEVDMITLGSIDEIKNKMIDFITIDTEGNEYNVVSSINFNDLYVRALVVENNYKQSKIENYLKSFGYILISRLETDDVYILKKEYTFPIRLRLLIWNYMTILKKIKKKFHFN